MHKLKLIILSLILLGGGCLNGADRGLFDFSSKSSGDLPVFDTSVVCNDHSHPISNGSGCECDPGFFPYGKLGEPVKCSVYDCGPEMVLNEFGTFCECPYGYQGSGIIDGVCVKVECDADRHKVLSPDGHRCACAPGYRAGKFFSELCFEEKEDSEVNE